jgi:hypothetical protein
MHYLIYNNIFSYIEGEPNVGLVNKYNYNIYKKKRIDNASSKIYNFIMNNTIHINYLLDVVRHITYTHSKIIRYYIKYYPIEHLTRLIKLYTQKLNRPDLSISKDNNYTFRDLYNIQLKCTISEITYVGW